MLLPGCLSSKGHLLAVAAKYLLCSSRQILFVRPSLHPGTASANWDVHLSAAQEPFSAGWLHNGRAKEKKKGHRMDQDKFQALVPVTRQPTAANSSAGGSPGYSPASPSGLTSPGASGSRQEILTLGVPADSLNHPLLLALPDECGLLPITDSRDATSASTSPGSVREGMPAGELRLSTPISTENALQNNYEIVLYKNRNIVLFNPHTNRAGARSLTTAEERAIRLQ